MRICQFLLIIIWSSVVYSQEEAAIDHTPVDVVSSASVSTTFTEPSVALLNEQPLTNNSVPIKIEPLVDKVTLVMAWVILGLLYYLYRLKKRGHLAKQNQLLLESIFDQSYQYIGIIDQHGRLVSSNSKLQGLLYSQGYKLDRPIWQHKYWETKGAQRLKQYFEAEEETNLRQGGEQQEALATNQQATVSQFEVEIWHQEYGSLMLEVSFKPLPIELAGKQKYLMEARDITSRKITEDKLIEREESLSHYYDKQPVMMITLDDQNRIQQVNQFTEQLSGYSAEQVLGHYLSDFYLDADTKTPRQVLLLPQQDIKGVWRRDVAYRHQDGRTIWVRENIRPLVESGHLLIVGEDVTETRELSVQLEYQARYDLLTNIYNRNQFEIELKEALKEVEQQMRTHAMLYLDLDQLKVLNDTAGHDAGDAAIQFCASILEEHLPYNATLARMGGDEFSILLKDCTERDAVNVARSIITTLSEHPFCWDEIRLNLTCSIGIRLIDHTASSPQMVHAQADTACHAAKEEGRNRYNLYCQDDEALRKRHLEMESVNLVHHALANDRLELFAQQILGLQSDNDQMHFEILVRIKNQEGEYISPGIFMPASERYNIAHLIDTQVISHTLTWLENNPVALNNLGRCSINLSGHSMGNKAFLEFLMNRVDSSCVPNNKICLEITETAAMSNMNQAIEVFTQLKQKGCLIALDDFGSGLSSFGYLQKLPVDIVKIDGIFVQDLDVNEMDHLMVRSINDLAQKMGKQTVAEFVENTQILDRLLELGVDYCQGYIIGKPKPLADLVDELLEHMESVGSKVK